ncbi:MAG: hypothetical protein JSV03_05890, partial [Planctomycetota bacterium]
GAPMFDNVQILGCEGTCYMEVSNYRNTLRHYVLSGENIAAPNTYTVTNTGLEPLNYTVAEVDASGTPTNYPWLSVAPENGALAVGESEDVEVTYSTSSLPSGQHVAYIEFKDDCSPERSYIRSIKVNVNNMLTEAFDYPDGPLEQQPGWEGNGSEAFGEHSTTLYVESGVLNLVNISSGDPTPIAQHEGITNIWKAPLSCTTGLQKISFKIKQITPDSQNFAELGYMRGTGKNWAAFRLNGDNIQFMLGPADGKADDAYGEPRNLTGGWDSVVAYINRTANTIFNIPSEQTVYYFNGQRVDNPGDLDEETLNNGAGTEPDNLYLYFNWLGNPGLDELQIDDLEVTRCILPCSDPFADVDEDGDVDQDDFAMFQLCYSGNGIQYPGTLDYCACLDQGDETGDGLPDFDGDIDSFDFDAFQNCASGPDIPADITCDD